MMEEQNFDEDVKKNKKKIPNIVFALIVAVLTFVAVFGGIVVADYFISSKNNESSQQEESNQQESVSKEESTKSEVVQPSTGNSGSAKVKCVGSYYGETSGTFENGLSYSYKYTYVLNEDGTFTADYNGVSGTKGTFVINDDTISFTGLKEIVGPNDIQYATADYYIASDCSYILYDRSINFKLMRK